MHVFTRHVNTFAFKSLHPTHPEWYDGMTFNAHLANYLRRMRDETANQRTTQKYIFIVRSISLPIKWGDSCQPSLSGTDNRLRAVGHLQFTEDARDIVTYGFHTDYQRLGDLAIAASLRY
jgi:hypothetical protein